MSSPSSARTPAQVLDSARNIFFPLMSHSPRSKAHTGTRRRVLRRFAGVSAARARSRNPERSEGSTRRLPVMLFDNSWPPAAFTLPTHEPTVSSLLNPVFSDRFPLNPLDSGVLLPIPNHDATASFSFRDLATGVGGGVPWPFGHSRNGLGSIGESKRRPSKSRNFSISDSTDGRQSSQTTLAFFIAACSLISAHAPCRPRESVLGLW
jgi:hypothetical protein